MIRKRLSSCSEHKREDDDGDDDNVAETSATAARVFQDADKAFCKTTCTPIFSETVVNLNS